MLAIYHYCTWYVCCEQHQMEESKKTEFVTVKAYDIDGYTQILIAIFPVTLN